MLGLGNLLTKSGVIKKFPNDFSFNFDGSNDYLEAGKSNALGTGTNFSISFWFKSEASSKAYIAQIQKGSSSSGLAFLANSVSTSVNTGHITALVWNGSTHLNLSFDGSIDDGEWHHMAFTTTSSAQVLYFDGQSVDTDTITFNNAFDSNPLVIGARGGGAEPFNGLIDEFAVWNVALSGSDVTSIYNNRKIVDFSKASTYATDRTSNLKLWLRAGDKVLPESDTSIARSDFYTDFDGTDDFVEIADDNSLDLANGYTITAWIKADSDVTDWRGIVAKRNGTSSSNYLIYVNKTTGVLGSYDTSTELLGTKTLNDNTWHHVAISNDGSNTVMYVDGTVDKTGTQSNYSTNNLPVVIGEAGHNGTAPPGDRFLGGISNVGIYQTVIDSQTISQMAKSRFTPMRDNRFSVVDLDGSDDTINVDFTNNTVGQTYSFWWNTTNTAVNRSLFQLKQDSTFRARFYQDYAYQFRIGTQADSNYVYAGASGNSTGVYNNGAWHHILVYIDNTIGSSKVYANGVALTMSGASGSSSVGTSNTLVIGNKAGSISQFAVWSGDKTSSAYAIYSNGITSNWVDKYSTDLLGYWRMGDDTSKAYPTIADSSSNSNDGTITNGASDDIVQQMVAGYDMGAFESTEEVNGELNPNPTFSNFTGNVPNGWGVVGDDDSGNNISQGSAGGLRLQSDGGSIFAHLADVNVVGKTYHFSITITNVNDDDFSFKTLNTKFFNGDGKSAGTYTGTYVAEATYVRIFRDDSCDVEITAFSIKEEIQSADLSDTYPAIIDVNEPVLGAELVDSNVASSWTAIGNNTIADITNGVRITYVDDGDGAKALFSDAKILNTDLTVGKFYKVTFNAYYEGGSAGVLVRIYDSTAIVYSTSALTTSDTSYTLYFKATHATNAQLYLQNFASSNIVYITNLSTKEVSGNVGTMTNQDSADLVYSSVLPDQSFLATGVNSAYNFIDLDGADQYIDCGDGTSLDTTSQLTLSSWVNFDSTGTNVILARDDNTNSNYILYGWSDGKIYAQIQISGVGKTVDGGSYSSDTWYHVVVTFDGSSLKIYVDADLKDTLSASGSIDNDDVSLEIGRKGNNAFHFDGQIGQTAIWNKSLSSTEVGAIYTLGRHGNLLDSYSDNLVGNWAMSSLDSATGLSDSISTVYDRSGNSNHGNPTNADAGDLASSPNATPNGYSKNETNRSTTTP